MHNKENLRDTLASQFVDFDLEEPAQTYRDNYGQQARAAATQQLQ
jgi:hypothetical protein